MLNIDSPSLLNCGLSSRLLKNVFEAASARQKLAKKRSLCAINEYFEPIINAAIATQIVFQQPARLTIRLTGLLLLSLLVLSGCSNDKSGDLHIGISHTFEHSGLGAAMIAAFRREHSLDVEITIADENALLSLLKDHRIDSALLPTPANTDDASLHTQPLFTQRYFIAGPNNDPAHIQLSLTVDEVIKKIANSNGTWLSQHQGHDLQAIEQAWLADKDITINIIEDDDQALLKQANKLDAYFIMDQSRWLRLEDTQNNTPLFTEEDNLHLHYSAMSLQQHSNESNTQLWRDWLNGNNVKSLIAKHSINEQPTFTLIESL